MSGDYLWSALLKKLTADSINSFRKAGKIPSPAELFDEIERRGVIFCKKEGIEFKDTFAFVQLQNLRQQLPQATS